MEKENKEEIRNINSRFENLEDRMMFYRKRPEQRLPRNSYVLVMIDGRSFSSKIKKKFKRPFDDAFIGMMNDTCAYLCSQIQGCVLGYVQSDEISLFLTDVQTPESTLFYDGRLVKLLSIIPSMATAFFNRKMTEYVINSMTDESEIKKAISSGELYQFDCKCWDVPTLNDVIGWFLFRQIDCIRNSKQQAAQTYLPHKRLLNKTTDEQVEMLKEEKGIDWYNDFNDGEKYGRIIYKEKERHVTEVKGERVEYERSVWNAHYGKDLTVEENRAEFIKIISASGITSECDNTARTVANMLYSVSSDAARIRENLILISEINEYFPNELPTYCDEFDSKDYVTRTDELISDSKKLIDLCSK